jgi:hypothetical protein
MYGKGTLAATGVGFTILGVSVSLSLVAGVAAGAVVAGCLLYRHFNRGKRYAK